ncbi:MAG: hypothetical protein ABIH50_05565 [bacterium]
MSEIECLPEKTKRMFRAALVQHLEVKCANNGLALSERGLKYFLALSALGIDRPLKYLRDYSKRIVRTGIEHANNIADRGMVDTRPIAQNDLLAVIMNEVLKQEKYNKLGSLAISESEKALLGEAIGIRDHIYYNLKGFFEKEGDPLVLAPHVKPEDIDRSNLLPAVNTILTQAMGVPSPLTFYILPCRHGQVFFDVQPFSISHEISQNDLRRGTNVYGQPIDRKSMIPGQRQRLDGNELLIQSSEGVRLACFRMVLGRVRGKIVCQGAAKENPEVLKIHSPVNKPAFDFWVGGDRGEKQLLASLIETINLLVETEQIEPACLLSFENGMLGIVEKYLKDGKGDSIVSVKSWLVEVGRFKEAADNYLSKQKGRDEHNKNQ